MMLSKIEASLIAAFLEDLSNRYANDGCNDLSLPNTPENVEFVKAAETYEEEYPEDWEVHESKDGKKIYTNNMVVVGYLERRMREVFQLLKEKQ